MINSKAISNTVSCFEQYKVSLIGFLHSIDRKNDIKMNFNNDKTAMEMSIVKSILKNDFRIYGGTQFNSLIGKCIWHIYQNYKLHCIHVDRTPALYKLLAYRLALSSYLVCFCLKTWHLEQNSGILIKLAF